MEAAGASSWKSIKHVKVFRNLFLIENDKIMRKTQFVVRKLLLTIWWQIICFFDPGLYIKNGTELTKKLAMSGIARFPQTKLKLYENAWRWCPLCALSWNYWLLTIL